jgi:hypothetical protein
MQTDFAFNAERLWRICKRCVLTMDTLDGKTMTNYGFATAMLLLGTAAQESNFKWERQRSPKWDGAVGGFSKWQVEVSSIMQTRDGLRDVRLERALSLVFNDPKATGDSLVKVPIDQLLWALKFEDNDHLGVLFAREHYRRVPAPIPVSMNGLASANQIGQLAKYWKNYYNTSLGSGTVEQFQKNYYNYCACVIEPEAVQFK